MDMHSLRKWVEEALAERIETLAPESTTPESLETTREQLRVLLHELQVYEAELEIQNHELRQTQMELEKSRDRYADLFDFSPVGYINLDRHGVIQDINLTAAQLLGRPRQRLAGFPLIHFMAADNRPLFLDHLRRCAREKTGAITTELRLASGDGDSRMVELHSVAEPEERGGQYRTAITCIARRKAAEDALRQARDSLEQRVTERTAALSAANDALRTGLSEREHLAQELRLRNQALADADRHKDEFMAMLAHELRNPLAAIANAGEILKRHTESHPKDDVCGRTARIIEQQCAHFKVLLDDLLDVARVTHGKIVLDKRVAALGDILEQAAATHRGLIEERGQRLSIDFPATPLHVEVDFTRCVQSVGNLLHNAAKFTPRGGSIELAAWREGDVAAVRVRDDGTGIAAELLPHIFEPFTQEDRSLARSTGGLGIGLALVRRLVEMHGGRVEAASAGPGRGSQFTLWLPVVAAPGTEMPPPRIDIPKPQAGCRVFIVDDNADYADSLGVLLGMQGYETEVFYQGETALRRAAEHPPDAVLLDIGMPGISGYEVARRLRDECGLTGTRLIAISGYSAENDRQLAQGSGFDHYLVKPVEIDVLLGLLPG
ncbi:hypothetical protein MishRS11D_11980 [Methylomagnum ishizawai]|nr:hypothetical protein MishRS11D_11980 [Methylomagnum ishizawai]